MRTTIAVPVGNIPNRSHTPHRRSTSSRRMPIWPLFVRHGSTRAKPGISWRSIRRDYPQTMCFASCMVRCCSIPTFPPAFQRDAESYGSPRFGDSLQMGSPLFGCSRESDRMIGVYGADGFIGRHVIRRLADGAEPVRAVSRTFDSELTRSLQEKIDFAEIDLREPLAVASSLQDVGTVVQLISTSSPGLRNEHVIADIEENVIPQVEFLQACVQAGVKRIVFLSSGGTVYGPDAPVPTPETSPTDPINSHGLTKLIVEKYIQMYGRINDLEYVILRVANAFGPGQSFSKGQGLIPAILSRCRRGLPVRVFGDGEAKRDYIYIDDVVDAIEAAIHLPGSPREILNVGSGEVRSVLEVIEAIETAIGRPIERESIDARSTDVEIAGLDISEAKRVLGWSPKLGFEEGLRRIVNDE
ncbi:MAG: NAD-dependent epimerase/dehydratase family protein [Acidimicrobiia bacterium]|nr:NAD-dependent epimerase/dehydratase family protein [Acidimicrobiia bacterium]